jgi:RNA polymerase sigma-70 factor, ECF subfamily
MASEEDSEGLRGVVARAAARDADAWEHLYRRGYVSMFAYARRRVASDAAADDAVSEAMTRALEKIDRFTWQGAGFDVWLFGIPRNVVLEQYRRTARDVPDETPDQRPTDPEHDPSAILARAERDRELRAEFAALDDDDRELLELRVVAGLSAEAVAEVVGKRAGAVRMAQKRALARLRARMEDRDRA